MNRLLTAVARPHDLDSGEVLHPRMSIGLTEIHRHEDIEEAVHRADAAMYQAKNSGGGRVQVAP